MEVGVTEIITSGIAAISVIGAAAITTYQKRSIQKERVEHNTEKIGWDTMSRVATLKTFNQIKGIVDGLLNKTSGTRFLILVAVNGKVDLRHVSVIYEQHFDSDYPVNAVTRYNRLKVDEPYIQMLKHVEHQEPVNLDVSNMDNSLLKKIYRLEGVNYSKVTFLHRASIDEKNDVVIYSSIATHADKPFTQDEKTEIKLTHETELRPLMKELFKNYYE